MSATVSKPLGQRTEESVGETKTSNPQIVTIIGYGESEEGFYEMKIDSITSLDDQLQLNFKNFELKSQKEIDLITYKKVIKQRNIKEDPILPSLPFSLILSFIFSEKRKQWDNSILKRIEYEKQTLYFLSRDENGTECFITVLVAELHRIRIIIRSKQQMQEFLFQGNYIGTTKDFLEIQDTKKRFFGEN